MSKPTTLVAPDGQRFDVPTPAGVATLKAKGFRDLNEAERKDVELQSKFGEGVLPPIGAAAAGAARTLTFGASDALVSAISPEAREGLQALTDKNPVASTVGEVAGLAVPVVGELGAATSAGKALAKGAGSAITGVSKAAELVGKGAAAATKVVGLKGAAPFVGGAVQAAAEGAAFQIGSNLGAAARRDSKLDAETLLAHTGEVAILGAGLGAAIPAAGKVARWSANKAIAGIEKGAQGLRKLGYGAADLGVDAIEAGAGAVARNAEAIGAGIESGAKSAAGALDKGAAAVVGRADAIGGAVAGAGDRVGSLADDVLLPRIRKSLGEQTGRPDVIDEVFSTGAEGQALRKKLGRETITGVREEQAEELGRALNPIWEQTLDNSPMLTDVGFAVKRDLQAAELGASEMTRKAQAKVVRDILGEANTTLEQLAKFNPTAQKYFQDAIDDFAKTALTKPSAESIFVGLDGLKVATDKIAKWSQGAKLGDSGAAFAADEARRFRTFAKQALEDTALWGEAGTIQQQFNAAFTRRQRAFAQFEKQFSGTKAEGARPRVLDGKKIKAWARDMTGQAGDVRNAVVDDLIEAETELVGLVDRLSKRVQEHSTARLHGDPSASVAREVSGAPMGVTEALTRSAGDAGNLARAKATAAKALDRAEVLQETQSAILSRQGAGVNPLPVDLAQKIGAGALVGGVVGGMPGAVIGGAVTSALQKYGAVTTNPKSAIEFLNTIDKIRGVDKDRVAKWVRSLLGETAEQGARGKVAGVAAKVDGKKIGAALRKGAEATQAKIPRMRASVKSSSEETARKILAGRAAAERGVSDLAMRLDAATPGIMRRILPAVSYADVVNSKPDEWWARTQKAITAAQANPDAMIERLHKDIEAIAGDLPNTAAAITDQQMRVFGFLVDAMPRNPRPYVVGGQPWTPTPSEMKQFRDLVLVATKPDTLLPLITLGTATRSQVDAVRLLWPRKFEETRAQVMNAITTADADGHRVPYSARVRVGRLLGVPLDPSMEPGFGAWIDAPPAEQAETGETTRGTLGIDTDRDLPLSARTAERK